MLRGSDRGRVGCRRRGELSESRQGPEEDSSCDNSRDTLACSYQFQIEYLVKEQSHANRLCHDAYTLHQQSQSASEEPEREAGHEHERLHVGQRFVGWAMLRIMVSVEGVELGAGR